MEVIKQLKQLTKDTFFYGLGSTLQRFIGLLLFPIYTRLLTQEDFGAQDLVFTATSISFTLLILGFPSSVSRFYYEAETESQKKSILSTWLWFELAISIPICFLLVYFAGPICQVIYNDASLAPLFQIAIGAQPFVLTSNVSMLILRLTFQSRKYSFLATVGVLIQAIFAIVAVVVLRRGVIGLFWAYFFANLTQMLLGLAYTFQSILPVFSFSWLKQLIFFGLPIVPASLSIWILNSSNRYFLSHLASLGEVGQMSVGSRIASIATFAVAAFLVAWGPFAFSLIRNPDLAKDTYSKAYTYYFLLTSTAFAGLGIFAREAVIVLATPDYQAAAYIVPFLCLGTILWGAADIVGMGFSIAKKTYHVTIATFLGAMVSTLLNILLIPGWGILGAAAATMLGSASTFLYDFVAGQRYFFVKYENGKIFKTLTAAITAVSASLLIDHLTPTWTPVGLLVKCLFLTGFVSCLFLFKVIDREQIQSLWAFFKIRLGKTLTRKAGA